MSSKEWDASQELTEFKQPPKKTNVKHLVKEEKKLELSKGFVLGVTSQARTQLQDWGVLLPSKWNPLYAYLFNYSY